MHELRRRESVHNAALYRASACNAASMENLFLPSPTAVSEFFANRHAAFDVKGRGLGAVQK
jgi:hypothetical protein